MNIRLCNTITRYQMWRYNPDGQPWNYMA